MTDPARLDLDSHPPGLWFRNFPFNNFKRSLRLRNLHGTHFFCHKFLSRYYISIALALTGLTIAAITRNEHYHEFYAVFFLIQTIIISFAIFHTLV